VPLEPEPPEGEVVPLAVLGEVELDGTGELVGEGEPAGKGTFAVGEPVATGVVVGAAVA